MISGQILTEHMLGAGPSAGHWGHVGDMLVTGAARPHSQGAHSPMGANDTGLGSHSMSEQSCDGGDASTEKACEVPHPILFGRGELPRGGGSSVRT